MLRIRDVAGVLGVTRQRVQQLHRQGRLPSPAAHDAVGPLWRQDDVERWADTAWWGDARAPWRRRGPERG